MGFLKSFVLICIFCLPWSFARSAANSSYQLSNTARLEWTRNIDLEPNPLLMHKGVWFEGEWMGKPFSVWVSRIEGRATTLEEAKREWLLLIEKGKSEGRMLTDKGCSRKDKSLLICQKFEIEVKGNQNKKKQEHILTQTIWSNSKDLIHIRFHVYDQQQLTEELLREIKLVFDRR